MSVLFFVLGVLAAAIGGDRFVRGAVGLASWWRIPAGIIGATIAAFATSSPELSVGVLAALDGRSELAFGDATGSNMVNLGVVLGLTLVIGGLSAARSSVRREVMSVFVALPLLLFLALDGGISRLDAAFLLVLFALWIAWVVRDARSQRSAVEEIGESSRRATVLDLVAGLALLVLAGQLIVESAKDMGESLGWSEFVVGSIVVAIGTSTPELVTTIISARKGHVEVGIGTILGSNLFNSLFTVGVAGLIEPIDVDRPTAAVALIAALVASAFVIPDRRARLGRIRGVVLVLAYAGFVSALLVLV